MKSWRFTGTNEPLQLAELPSRFHRRTGAGRRRREGGRHPLPPMWAFSHRSGLDDDAGAGCRSRSATRMPA